MIIKSSAGTEHVRAEYSITRDINGIPTLETEYFQPIHHHVDPIKVHIKDSDDVYIVVINESDTVVDSSRVKLTAVHSLIYDFTGSRIYEEITQHFSIEGILSIVFDDTDYDFEVAGDRSYYAMQFQNFGGARTRLELLNQICDRWECEYDVVGNMVYIKDKVGAKDTENKKFRYLMNINDSKVEFDITEGATYIKGYFGKQPDEDDEETENTYFELDYTHQLANQYGIRHAEPYSNENITTTETAEQYLKNRLENTWRLSIDIDVVELESSTNSEYFLGDVVWAIDERIDIDMQTRIIKIVKTYDIDDRLLSTNVILGNKSFVDYVLGSTSGVSEFVTLEDLERETMTIEEEIVRKMAEFDDAFNLARDQMRVEYNQAYANALAEIEALDEKMATEIANEIASFEADFNAEVQAAKDLAAQQIADTEQRINLEIDTARSEMESDFNAEVQAAKDLAAQQIADTEQRINTTIDTTRNEMESEFDNAVAEAREYAEQQAEQHANAVDSKLETMRDTHAGLIQQNSDNIADVNDFIGPRDRTLQIILDEQRAELEQKIEVYSRTHPNLQVGTTFENIQGWRPWNGIHGELELRTNESLNFVRIYPSGSNSPSMESLESITLESDKHYVVAVDFRSDDVQDLDNSYFLSSSGNISIPTTQTRGLTADGTWNRYYFDLDMTGRASGSYRLMLGSHFNFGDTNIGTFDLRQIHVYEGTTHGISWTPSPSDNAQIVSQILYEIRELEDGMSSLATKTELDIVTGNVTQLTNEFTTTSDLVSSKLQNFDDLLGDNGSHFTQVADQVQSKVWLNDIHNPNLLSYTDVNLVSDRIEWNRWNVSVTGSAYNDEFMWIRNVDSASTIGIISPTLRIEEGRTYTLSWVGFGNENMNVGMNYCYVMYSNTNRSLALPSRTVIPTSPNQYGGRTVYRYRITFTGHYSDTAGVMIGGYTQGAGLDVSFYVKEPKLELGDRATSYYTAFSGITQRISEIELLTQEIDGGVLRQSDITVSPSSVRIGSTEILGDDVLASVLNVSPSAIDMITQKMRLSGDLYVDGDITSLAISAVEGNFANLLASNIDSVSINAGNITTGTLNAYRLAVNSVLVDRLFGYSVFANEVTAKAVDAVEGNFARLFASRISTVNLDASNITTGTLASARLRVDNALINRLVANSILTGEMTSRSVTAINANFGTLFASAISTVDLNADNIKSGTLSSTRLQVNNALINRLISNSILTGEMRAQSLTAVRGDIADLRTRILTSDVITSNHISVNNALIDKMFANSALISRLTSKTAFINNAQAITIDAIEANIDSIRTQILTSNVVQSTHVTTSNAMINKLFANNAQITTLTSKTAFISNIRAIDLAADQVRVGFNGISNNVTINSSGVTIRNGALTVHRTDNGAPTIISGSNPNGVHLVASTPNRRDSGFTTQGQYAVRPAGSSYMIYDFYMFEWFYSDLMLDFAILNTTSSEIRVRMHVRGTDGSTFSREVDYTIPANTAIFPRMIVNLGVPDGSTQRFFIEARNVGGSSYLGSFGIHTYMVKHLDNGNDYPRLEFS